MLNITSSKVKSVFQGDPFIWAIVFILSVIGILGLRYLSVVRQKRGHQVADQLEADCKQQWGLGNRGKKGDWRGL